MCASLQHFACTVAMTTKCKKPKAQNRHITVYACVDTFACINQKGAPLLPKFIEPAITSRLQQQQIQMQKQKQHDKLQAKS